MTERRRGSVVVSTDCYQEVARSPSLCIILNYQTAMYLCICYRFALTKPNLAGGLNEVCTVPNMASHSV